MGHVDGIVEHHDAAVAEETVARREGLIVEWCIEQTWRKIGAKGAANLHGAHLGGANLTDAKLTGADLTGALADAGTRWPGGFDPATNGVTVAP